LKVGKLSIAVMKFVIALTKLHKKFYVKSGVEALRSSNLSSSLALIRKVRAQVTELYLYRGTCQQSSSNQAILTDE
jgi:hypothetical protein